LPWRLKLARLKTSNQDQYPEIVGTTAVFFTALEIFEETY